METLSGLPHWGEWHRLVFKPHTILFTDSNIFLFLNIMLSFFLGVLLQLTKKESRLLVKYLEKTKYLQ